MANTRSSRRQSGDTHAFRTRSAAQLLTDSLPIPASRLEPVLSYADLLRIEEMFQHVVGNTVAYSKAVWQSMTPEERAILLERYTIGVPFGGVEDESQEVPLLNAVGNQVIGFFGNSMVMPFSIPPDLAEQIGVNNRDIQDALLRFRRQGFIAPQGGITLPTRGTLGEAVLGSCNSCEKIDLTRFWNWRDSPVPKIDERPDLSILGQASNQLVGPTGAQAPSSLAAGASASFVNNLIPAAAAVPQTSLLEKMVEKLPPGSTVEDITGLAKLAERIGGTETSASNARKEALDAAKSLAEKAMTQLPEVMKAKAGIEEKEAKDRAAALKTLTDNAQGLAELAGNAEDPKAFVESEVLEKLFGGKPDLTVIERASLIKAFSVSDKDNEATKKGKAAFREVLGLSSE